MNYEMQIIGEVFDLLFNFINVRFTFLGYSLSIFNILYGLLAMYLLGFVYRFVKDLLMGKSFNINIDDDRGIL